MCPVTQATMSHWRAKADSEGIILAWPDVSVKGQDDYGFMNALIAHFAGLTSGAVDAQRIYMAGFSAGCMLAQTFALRYSAAVAAVGCQSGHIIVDETPSPFSPMAAINVMGNADIAVQFSPGTNDRWAVLNNCVGAAVQTTFPSFVEHRYATCDAGVEAVLIELPGVGHDTYRPNTPVQTTTLVWSFISRYRRTGAGVSGVVVSSSNWTLTDPSGAPGVVQVGPPPAPLGPCGSEMELVVVLDRSGSITWEHANMIAFARAVVHDFQIGPSGARASIIQFNHDAQVLTELTSDASVVDAAISAIGSANGMTSISDGLGAATVVLEAARPNVQKTVLLLTDGEQTVDGGANAAISTAAQLRASGATLFALGFAGATSATLEAMASTPSSTYAFFAPTLADVTAHFASIGGFCTAAASPKVPPPPTVYRYELPLW